MQLFKTSLVMHTDLFPSGHDVPLDGAHIQPMRPFIVIIINLNLEVMKVFPGENLKSGLIVLVGDAVPHSGAKHHL